MAYSKRTRGQSDKEVIADLEALTADDSMLRSALEQAWFINHINYLGFQWSLIDHETGAIDEIPNDVKFRRNMIQAKISHTVSKVTAEPPDWDVDSDTETRAVQGAKNVAEKVLEYVWDKEQMQIKSRDLATFARIGGTGLIRPVWDKDAGKALDPDDLFPEETRSPEDVDHLLSIFNDDVDAATRFLSGEDKIRDGDLRLQVLNPFDVYVDPAAEDEESANWVIIKQLTSVGDVKTRYGKDVDPERVGDGDIPSLKYQIMRHVSPNVSSGGSAHARIENSVEVHEFWERPTPDHPRGRMVAYANGVVLRKGDNPFHGLEAEIPICRVRDIPRCSGFWGMAATDSAIPIQRNYNKSRSNLVQADHDLSQGKWMVPRGAAINAGALDRSSNEVLEYNLVSTGTGAPAKPERVSGGSVSNLTTTSLELCSAEMDEAYGVSDVSQGQAPSGVTAGVALDLLLRESDTRLGALTAELNACYTRLGKMVLDIMKRFVTEPRSFTEIVGVGGHADAVDFVGQDLSWRNVRVRMGSKVERRRMRRRQSAIELLQYAPPEFWSEQQSRNIIMTAAGFSDAVLSSESTDTKRGKKIISQLRQGQYPPLLPWQNHEAILSVLTDWMNSLDFDEEDEGVQQLAVQQWQDRLAAIPPPPMPMMDAGQEGPGVAAQGPQQPQATEQPQTELPVPGLPPSIG